MAIIQTDLLIIGGSDAGISAALRARELNSEINITIILADEFPNLSICGIPYAISGEVTPWQNLAHRTIDDLKSFDIDFYMNTWATKIDAEAHQVVATQEHKQLTFSYNQLMVGTGAIPKQIPILGQNLRGVHVLHTMGDFLTISQQLKDNPPKNAAIVGAGYVGIEMAEALRHQNIPVTLLQRGSEILSTIEPDLAQQAHQQLTNHDVTVRTNQNITAITETATGYQLTGSDDSQIFDFVLIVVGVKPNSQLLIDAGAAVNEQQAVIVNEYMQTNLPDIYAAGDLVVTKHRLLGETYLPLGTTSHKQGRIAGANMVGLSSKFAGIIGSQVLRVFDLIIARTGLLVNEALQAGYDPIAITAELDDHKGYIPSAQKITIRVIADKKTHQLLGAQLLGSASSEIAKRTDIFATGIYHHMTVAEFSDLDLTYSPIVGAPWDAVQAAVQQLELQLMHNTKNSMS